MIAAYSAHRPDSVTAALGIHLIVYCAVGACLAFGLYALLQPSRAPNSGLAAYDALPGAVAKYGKPSLATTVAEPKPPPARLLKAQISERADRRERCDYLVCPYISRARPCCSHSQRLGKERSQSNRT